MTDKMAAERELEEQLLEEQLMEAGSKLLRLPSSLDELLPLLDVSSKFSVIFLIRTTTLFNFLIV